mgnify:CR=1 FL=1
MSQPTSQPTSSKKQPTSPNTHNNAFDTSITLSMGIRKDFWGNFVPTVVNSQSQVGFDSFEIGTVCSLKSWVQGDKHASWTSNEERCSLNAVLGYYDDELVDVIPSIQENGVSSIALLDSLQREALKLAFVDHRVQCCHKRKYKTHEEYYEHANGIFKGNRRVGEKLYPAIHMSCPISTPPIMWKPGNKLGCFVKDEIFQFDEHPPRNTEPLNHLPFKSIVIPRVKLIFHTSETRYGIKLKLCRDIRVVRVGYVQQVYAENAYIGKKRKHSE